MDCETVVVAVPGGAGDLVRVLRGTYRGTVETAGVDPYDWAHTTTTPTLQQLRRLAAAGPSAAVDAATDTAFALGAWLALAAPAAAAGWERDDSSRT